MEQFVVNLRFDSTHHFLPFARGFHVLGSELCGAENIGDFRRYDVLGQRIQNDTNFVTDSDFSDDCLCQEGQIDI